MNITPPTHKRNRLLLALDLAWRSGLLACLVLICAVLPAKAATYSADFNSGLPAESAIYGDATNQPSAGFTNSGYLLLTTNLASQNGGFVITTNLDNGAQNLGFIARYKAYIWGSSGADGMSFSYAPGLTPPTGSILPGENGVDTGFAVSFDTYSNANDHVGIDIRWAGQEVGPFEFNRIRQNAWVDVAIMLHPDGNLSLMYDNTWIHTNFYCAFPVVGMQNWSFAFGARTGGSFDTQGVDELSITTFTNAQAYVSAYYPVGRAVRADAPIEVYVNDATDPFTGIPSQVDPAKIQLAVDGVAVTPTITQASPVTKISYEHPLFLTNSEHVVTLTYADQVSPVPNTNTWQWTFTVGSYGTLSTNYAADPSFVDLTKPGFAIRYSQIADSGARDTTRADAQLANLLIDPATGLPFANEATPNPSDGSFTYKESGVLNYCYPAGSTAGNFPGDAALPGTPSGTGSNYAMEVVTYLHLTPGLYSLGVNSSDGFKAVIADAPDLFAREQLASPGVRAAADTTVMFSVVLDGYYPFRIVYFVGDPNYTIAPGSTTPSFEFFNVDRTGTKVLINDTATTGYVQAFQPAKTRPYVRSVSPGVNETGVPGNSVIKATLVDGSITVQASSIQLLFNGSAVTPTIAANSPVTTITFDPPGDIAPNTTNTVQLAFTDSDAYRRTNSWQFTTANIFQEIWSIAPGSVPYVTTSGNERGLAYNPKTGHLLLVTRSLGPAQIEILNSDTGAKLGVMDTNGLTGGLFVLNQIDVADDGVIYAANMTTDSYNNGSRIYRWANESAVPTLAYSNNPANPGNLGSTTYGMRIGDVMVVRGSGAGTQILMGQNTKISTHTDPGNGTSAVLFTTTDGTNFTSKLLTLSGIDNGDLRLGLAFGCGETFFGKQTGHALRYARFDAVAGTASLIASYNITNPISTATIGPIGYIPSDQRLIGNATSANAVPHSMNLYDYSSMAADPVQNFPLDTRVFHTANTAFGTGAVDFTPDASRVFALDSGNGIIAFSMTFKPAAPVICAQPRNFLASAVSRLGFMDVGATGAPQVYQWRFSGRSAGGTPVPIANATNRTLDIPDVQQSQIGYYSVVITNVLGAATSTPALLNVQLVITSQPANLIATQGIPAVFTVATTGGAEPLSYQWKYFGTNIVDATNSSYTIQSPAFSDAAIAAYSVEITDYYTQKVTSAAASLNVLPSTPTVPGTGTGLLGMYYANVTYTANTPPDPFTGVPTLTRVDPTVNFDWVTNSFDTATYADKVDYFQVRWVGEVQPLYSQTYTFYGTTDDGQRLWVNNTQVIENWVLQAAAERSGTIALTAGQKYPITYEYFEKGGNASAKLSWWSPSQVKTIVPMEQLYPGTGPLQTGMTSSVVNGTNIVLNWVGTCVLEAAPEITGPWAPVLTNAGPVTLDVQAAERQFYRLQTQQF